MKHRQVRVRALRADGTVGNVDVLDLDDASFRSFIIDRLVRARLVDTLNDDYVTGESIPLRERTK